MWAIVEELLRHCKSPRALAWSGRSSRPWPCKAGECTTMRYGDMAKNPGDEGYPPYTQIPSHRQRAQGPVGVLRNCPSAECCPGASIEHPSSKPLPVYAGACRKPLQPPLVEKRGHGNPQQRPIFQLPTCWNKRAMSDGSLMLPLSALPMWFMSEVFTAAYEMCIPAARISCSCSKPVDTPPKPQQSSTKLEGATSA